MTTILIVDDESNMRWVLQRALDKAGFETLTAARGQDALGQAARQRVDLALVDLKMPGMDGLAVLRDLHQRQPDLPVILLTAYATVPTAVEAMRLGALDYLRKPFDVEEVLFKIANALQRQALQAERNALTARLRKAADFSHFIGASLALAEPLARARAAADCDLPVLISGEPGAGKSLLARLIHGNSDRADAALVEIDCGSLVADALHEALLAERGRWRQALGGTLLLRRLDRLPAEQAEALAQQLAALQRTSGRPAGLRPMATIASRLSPSLDPVFAGIHIELPPLRRRLDDLPLLVRHLAPRAQLSGLARSALLAYAWPGNVVELGAVLAHAQALAGETPIEIEHLPARVISTPGDAAPSFHLPPGGIDLEQVERELIRQALDMAQGNKSQAARLLGLTRHTLLYRLEKHGLG